MTNFINPVVLIEATGLSALRPHDQRSGTRAGSMFQSYIMSVSFSSFEADVDSAHLFSILRDSSITAELAHPGSRQHCAPHPLLVIVREKVVSQGFGSEIRFEIVRDQVLFSRGS